MPSLLPPESDGGSPLEKEIRRAHEIEMSQLREKLARKQALMDQRAKKWFWRAWWGIKFWVLDLNRRKTNASTGVKESTSSTKPNSTQEESRNRESSVNQDALKALLEGNTLTKVILRFFVREGQAVKSGWVAIIIIVGLFAYVTYEHTASSFKEQITALKDTHANENKLQEARIHNLERDIDQTRQERNKAQSDLAPWITLGNQLQHNAPPDKRMDLLLEQVQALQKIIQDKATNPFKEPISALELTVEAIIEPDHPKAFSNYDGSSVWIGFCRGPDALVDAATVLSSYQKNIPDGVKFRFQASVAADNPIMGNPIVSLRTAEYIQIMLPKDLVPKGTKIVSGRVTLVINSRITLRFDIAPQHTIAVSAIADDSSFIFVRPLNGGFSAIGP